MNKVSTVNDYLTYVRSNRKIVALPSGNAFEIKKLTGRDYLSSAAFEIPITTAEAAQGDDTEQDKKARSKARWDAMSAEQKKKCLEMNEWMVCASVVNPPVSLNPEEGKICIKDIPDEDYTVLLDEINKFSSKGGNSEMKSFRPEQKHCPAGHDCSPV